jgi:hypothetical protein
MNADDTETAEAYALLRGFELTGQLGSGLNGRVWTVTGKDNTVEWALKIQDEQGFKLERACYERLAELGVTEVAGFNVPVLIHAEEGWRAIEMSIVDRPFILDFAQAYLDAPPEFSAEVWEECWETWEGRYEDDWPQVKQALRELRLLGIYYLDVHRGNIAL